jgi:hypothetical protein
MKRALTFVSGVAASILAFSNPASAQAPPGWTIAGSAPTDFDFGVDKTIAGTGTRSAFIAAKADAKGAGFGTLMQVLAPDNYRGARWRLTGRMRTEGAGRAQMWMRIDGPDRKMLGFDNMDSRPVTATTGWSKYEIVLDVPPSATAVALGFFLIGPGKVWGDEFKLEKVDASVPVTSNAAGATRTLSNPDFEE